MTGYRTGKKEKTFRIRAIILIVAAIVIAIAAAAVIYQAKEFSLKVNGSADMTIGLNGVYEEQGAKAQIKGKDLSGQIKIEGKVDTSKPGEYVLKYKIKGISAKRTVMVLDEMNPKIELKEDGENANQVKLGEKFKEPGFTAIDEDGKDITSKVKVSDSSLNKTGKGKIWYTAEDSKGNKTRVSRDVKVLENTEYETPGLPICMYHYVYDEENPPDDLYKRFGNYISAQDLEEELNWLNEENYYYPTWQEVRDYIDGKLMLPEKSIVLCFDDGAKSFLENGIPVLEKCKVPATCFMITSSDGEEKIAEYKSDYVNYESHSHNMHRPGGNIGHGGIFTAIDKEAGLADLEESIKICGNGNAFAYPYGDYNDRSIEMVKEAGFLCAVTTQYGKAKPGDEPLLLPRVRMVMGQSLENFKGKVSP